MSDGARMRALLIGGAVLLVVAVVLVVRDWRATEADEDRTRQQYTCAIQREEGLTLDEDC